MLNDFLREVSVAGQVDQSDLEEGVDMPYVEAERAVISHYLRTKRAMDAFDKGPLYFIFGNVKVFEKGRRDVALIRERETAEGKIFGNRGLK